MSCSPRAGYRLSNYRGGRARPSAINNPSFHVAWRQMQPNDAQSNSPSIDTTLLDPAPVFVAKFSGPSQLELSTQRDRISYPFFRRDYSRADDRPNSGNVPSRSDISTSLPSTSCSSLGGSNFCVSGVTTSIVINDVARPIKSAGNSGAT